MFRFYRFRLTAAMALLLSLLFMQLAVASYVCPTASLAMAGSMEIAKVMPAPQAMPGCVEMDAAQPSLCHSHEQAGTQSLDRTALPLVQPFAAVGLGLIVLPLVTPSPDSVVGASSVLETRATAPPLAIRNCCFRI